jgi:hypothetical protein
MDAAAQGEVHVTPPFKPQLEEKMLFAFLWMEQLHAFWREQLGDKTWRRYVKCFPTHGFLTRRRCPRTR